MSIDPKILARMKVPPQSDSPRGNGDELPGMPATPPQASGLPALRGSPAQIKWATTIRAETLALVWPAQQRSKLKTVVDSSWWIANKTITKTMKYKEPVPHQLSDATAPAQPAQDMRARLTDAEQWARSVSQHPKLAEAAILATLSRLYKGEMKEQLRRRANDLLAIANEVIGKDVEAIRKMLTQ